MAKKKTVRPAPELVSENGRVTPINVPAAVPAATAPTWGTAGAAAYTPDYDALLAGDSILGQQNANRFAGHVGSIAERKANNDRAYANFGEDLNFSDAISGLGLDPNSPMFKALLADIDPATQQAARDMSAAGLSTSARLQRAHDTATDSFMSQLAARGSVRSGATGVASNLEGQNYLGAQFQSRNDLLSYLAGIQSAYAQSEGERQNQAATDTAAAATRQIAEHPATSAVAPIAGAPGTGSGAYKGPPIDTTGYYDPASYFAAHQLPKGTTTAQALAALAEVSRQLGTATYSLGGGSTFGSQIPTPSQVSVAPGITQAQVDESAGAHNDSWGKPPTLSPAAAAATVPTPSLSSFAAPSYAAALPGPSQSTSTASAPQIPVPKTSYSNSVFRRLNLPE